jgi:hypothetical protein
MCCVKRFRGWSTGAWRGKEREARLAPCQLGSEGREGEGRERGGLLKCCRSTRHRCQTHNTSTPSALEPLHITAHPQGFPLRSPLRPSNRNRAARARCRGKKPTLTHSRETHRPSRPRAPAQLPLQIRAHSARPDRGAAHQDPAGGRAAQESERASEPQEKQSELAPPPPPTAHSSRDQSAPKTPWTSSWASRARTSPSSRPTPPPSTPSSPSSKTRTRSSKLGTAWFSRWRAKPGTAPIFQSTSRPTSSCTPCATTRACLQRRWRTWRVESWRRRCGR